MRTSALFKLTGTAGLWLLGFAAQLHAETAQALPKPPPIEKKGTVGIDLCETSPFVLNGKLYRLEWFRNGSVLRIIDHATQKEISRFGAKHRFPCAIVNDGTVYVFATKEDQGWYGNTLTLFTSKDLAHWDEREVFHDKDYGICNTSVTRTGDGYAMSIEVNALSKESPGTFATRFLKSPDLLHWELTPKECRNGFEGYLKSPHLLRWDDGWYYLFTTVGGYPTGYVLLLERSRDLIKWEPSPFNPVMTASKDDHKILNPLLSEKDRADIEKDKNWDNSDIDFCEFKGRLIINYCWGTQGQGGLHEYVAEAEFPGTEAQFLKGFFPDLRLWAGIDITQPASMFSKDRAQYGNVLSAEPGVKLTVSSGETDSLPKLVSGTCPRPFAFHTAPEDAAWVTIDLGHDADLTGLLIRNRTDVCQDRVDGLTALVSDDGKTWRKIWQASKTEPLWEVSLLHKHIKARYIRLENHPKSPVPFHLQHVEVWGKEIK